VLRVTIVPGFVDPHLRVRGGATVLFVSRWWQPRAAQNLTRADL
jgi:hypothetical protein